MRWTFLKPGDIIIASDSTKKLCESYKHNPMLYWGMCCQKQHDEDLKINGFAIETFDDEFPIDRIVSDQFICDDKTSLLGDGERDTHTIGATEIELWPKIVQSGDEVYINSFEQLESNDRYSFRFKGSFRFSKLLVLDSHKSPGSYFFRRRPPFNQFV